MQADFCLEDPPTFQEVIPLSHLLPSAARSKQKGAVGQQNPQQTAKLLHEKVSYDSAFLPVKPNVFSYIYYFMFRLPVYPWM